MAQCCTLEEIVRNKLLTRHRGWDGAVFIRPEKFRDTSRRMVVLFYPATEKRFCTDGDRIVSAPTRGAISLMFDGDKDLSAANARLGADKNLSRRQKYVRTPS
jgi:hypothetical protein